MKNAMKTIGNIVCAMMLVFSMSACDNGSGDGGSGGNNDLRTIKVTGIPEAEYASMSAWKAAYATMVPIFTGEIEGTTATFELKSTTLAFDDITDSGPYFLFIDLSDISYNGTRYYYTGGKTKEELGISSPGFINKLPQYSLTSTVTTIAFDQFKEITTD